MAAKTNFKQTVTRYLDLYGEPEAGSIKSPFKPQKNVLVIPAFQERLTNLERVFANLNNTLIIIVVNSPQAKEPLTLGLLRDIEQTWTQVKSADNQSWFQIPSSLANSKGQLSKSIDPNGNLALVIDRCHEPIDSKLGVGRARKIGSDAALRLMLNGDVTTQWINSTDADAVLPTDYFASMKPDARDAFILYPFQHVMSDDLAAAQYEFSLLWYAFGLQFAGSDYAFPSVGSCIAFSGFAYAQVRGFPSRAAGEDFYLLNKLRKLGTYRYNPDSTISLSSRRSTRVPFGTGPGIRKIDTLPSPSDTQHYNPKVFLALKDFLQLLDTSYQVKNLNEHFSSKLHALYARETNLISILERQQQQKPKVFSKFLQDWFDGFRTLKFIHMARDFAYPSVSYEAVWESEVLALKCLGINSQQVKQASNELWQLLFKHNEPNSR